MEQELSFRLPVAQRKRMFQRLFKRRVRRRRLPSNHTDENENSNPTPERIQMPQIADTSESDCSIEIDISSDEGNMPEPKFGPQRDSDIETENENDVNDSPKPGTSRMHAGGVAKSQSDSEYYYVEETEESEAEAVEDEENDHYSVSESDDDLNELLSPTQIYPDFPEPSNLENAREFFNKRLHMFMMDLKLPKNKSQKLLTFLNAGGMRVAKTKSDLTKNPLPGPTVMTVAQGQQFVHYGLEDGIRNYLGDKILFKLNIVSLVIGCSGIRDTAGATLWPVLAYHPRSKWHFVLGAFFSHSEESNQNICKVYCNELADEIYRLKHQGFIYRGRRIGVNIKYFLTDNQTKSLWTATVPETCVHGCHKCDQKGTKESGIPVIYRPCLENLRTDYSFQIRDNEEHHTKREGEIKLENIGIKMVTQFPCDPMFCADLGSTKLLIKNFIKFKIISARQFDKISNKLRLLSKSVPSEITVKPRGFDSLQTQISSEFRNYLIYYLPVLLKDVIHSTYYNLFMLYSCAIRLLFKQTCREADILMAESLLSEFVLKYYETFKECPYNIHCLLHLGQCVRELNVPLKEFASYPFERYNRKIKKNTSSNVPIFETLHNVMHEESIFQQQETEHHNLMNNMLTYRTEPKMVNGKLFKNPMTDYNCLIMRGVQKIPFLINKFEEDDDQAYVVGRTYSNVRNFFDDPISSESVGVFLVDDPSPGSGYKRYSIDRIREKFLRIRHGDSWVLSVLIE